MNKEDLKNSIDRIEPDPYMATRLKAKISTGKAPKKSYRKAVTGIIAIALIFTFIFGFNLPSDTPDNLVVSRTEHTEQKTKTVSPFIMVAGAAFIESENPSVKYKTLKINDTFPFAYKISFIDVRGMSKSEREEVLIKAIDLAEAHMLTVNDGRVIVRGSCENIILTEHYSNYIKLDLKNIENVKSINVKTKTDWGQVEYCDGKLIETEFEKGNTRPIPHGKEITISAEQYHQDCEGFSWKNTAEMTQAIDANPDMPLSTYSDTITITVEYNDGSKEIGIIDVTFDDDGNATFTLREYKQE